MASMGDGVDSEEMWGWGGVGEVRRFSFLAMAFSAPGTMVMAMVPTTILSLFSYCHCRSLLALIAHHHLVSLATISMSLPIDEE